MRHMAIIIPNSKLLQNKFVNYSYGSQNVRLNISVGVAYGSDLERVSIALIEAAGSVEGSAHSARAASAFRRIRRLLSGFRSARLDKRAAQAPTDSQQSEF